MLAVSLVLLVVLAGCSGFPATESTVETTSDVDGDYPPGVSGDGIADSFALADAHSQTLRPTSFTVEHTTEIRYANGTLYTSETQTTRVAPDKTRFRYRATVDGTAPRFLGGPNGTVEIYANGSRVVRKLDAAGNVSYGLVSTPNGEAADPGSVYRGMPLQSSRIPLLFGQLENASITRQANGTTHVAASALSSETLTVQGTEVRNITAVQFTATVTDAGLVREYRLSVQGTVNGRPVTVTEHVNYHSIGSTRVPEPPWFDRATNQSTHSTVRP